MKFILHDGGRAAAGFAGKAGDCVARAVAIATQQPYAEVYKALAGVNAEFRGKHRKAAKRSARNGIFTQSVAFKRYMKSLGWKFVATMGIGTGCRVHLHEGELPMGRLIVSLSRHYTAVIDGDIYDTYDPRRDACVIEPDNGRELKPGESRNENGIWRVARRCVYGYWVKDEPTSL